MKIIQGVPNKFSRGVLDTNHLVLNIRYHVLGPLFKNLTT